MELYGNSCISLILGLLLIGSAAAMWVFGMFIVRGSLDSRVIKDMDKWRKDGKE
jgi:hypothetical protein